MFFINCEIELDLSWSKDCILSELLKTAAVVANPAAYRPALAKRATSTTSQTFQINSTKPYVPVVSLSISYSIKFLENLKQLFKRTISWNKCTSEITTQPKNNNLDCMIDPIFRNINRSINS